MVLRTVETVPTCTILLPVGLDPGLDPKKRPDSFEKPRRISKANGMSRAKLFCILLSQRYLHLQAQTAVVHITCNLSVTVNVIGRYKHHRSTYL